MKLFSKLILFLTIALAAQLNLNSMEGPKITQSLNQIPAVQELPSNIKQKLITNFDKLPEVKKLVILEHLSQASTAKSIKEIFDNLAHISAVNRVFYYLVHSKSFIRSITKAYLNKKKALGKEKELEQEFLDAARNGYAPIVKAMLLAGIYINTKADKGNTALIEAAKAGHINIVKALLSAGANPNIQNDIGDTALIETLIEKAISQDHIDTVKALLENKADPNIKNFFKGTALMFAAMNGHTNIVTDLLSAGANPNIQNDFGDTALIYAASGGHTDIVKALLSAGADPNIKDSNGMTALELAEKSGHKEIADLIMGKPIGKPITKSAEEEYLNKLKVANPYVILGVKHGASQTEIKEAFNNLARIWHPDKNPSPLAGEIFDLIYKAFMNLKS